MWSYSAHVNVYNPAAMTWEDTLPSFPYPRAGHGAVALGDSLLIIGGIGYGVMDDVSIYNGYEWQQGPNLPVELGNTGAAAVGYSIFVVGGTGFVEGTMWYEAKSTVLRYNFSDDFWVEIDTLNTARECHGVVAFDSKIYAIGGGQGDHFDRDYLSSIEVLDLSSGVDPVETNKTTFDFISMTNFPNPFSQSTNIDIVIGIGNSSHTPIIIYNILGREVMRWNRPQWLSRQLSLIWDGQDQFGNPLPTGVYFLQMQTENSVQTKKITILK